MYTKGPVEDITASDIHGFIDDFRNGKLDRIFKSEPVPERVTSPRVVRKIVGKNWDQEVNDMTKDVFVAYTSQYCKKCRQLEPIWKELAD